MTTELFIEHYYIKNLASLWGEWENVARVQAMQIIY